MTIQEREAIKQEVRKEIMDEMQAKKKRKEEYKGFTKGLDALIVKVYPEKCKERAALKSAISSVIKTCLNLDRLSNIPEPDMKVALDLAEKVVELVITNTRKPKEAKMKDGGKRPTSSKAEPKSN